MQGIQQETQVLVQAGFVIWGGGCFILDEVQHNGSRRRALHMTETLTLRNMKVQPDEKRETSIRKPITHFSISRLGVPGPYAANVSRHTAASSFLLLANLDKSCTVQISSTASDLPTMSCLTPDTRSPEVAAKTPIEKATAL